MFKTIEEALQFNQETIQRLLDSNQRAISALQEAVVALTKPIEGEIPVVKELCTICEFDLSARPFMEVGGSKYHVDCYGEQNV